MNDKREYSAIVVGAGLGGIATGVNLLKSGIDDFVILERSDGVGGTWRSNRYPGCGCDTQMVAYQFSFAISSSWDHLYPRASQILQYCEEVVDDFGLRPHLRTNVNVTEIRWDENAGVWILHTSAGEYRAKLVQMALGQFTTPKLPTIQGIDHFDGISAHTGAWDPEIPTEGTRIAVVGSAASAVQVIPELAKTAATLDVYQRTPNWFLSRGDREVGELEQRLLADSPDMVLADRNHQLAWQDILLWRIFEMDPTAQEFYTDIALAHLKNQVSDPDLREKLTPQYPLGCKRILLSDDFYPTIQLPHVNLITEGIHQVVAEGIETLDNTTRAYDVIVWATGFDEQGWYTRVPVYGRDSKSLAETWMPAPTSYYGLATSGFPNLFFSYGPNTNLGHGPITFMLERQGEYFANIAAAMSSEGFDRIEVRDNAVAAFETESQTRLKDSAWAAASCASYYKTDDGRVTKNWMGTMAEYKDALDPVRFEDYTLSP